MTLENVFLDVFNRTKQNYINQYPSMGFLRQWQLEPTQDQNIIASLNGSQQILRRYAGANFQCSYCGNQWYSRIHSSILFEYNPSTKRIKWKLFGQQCRICRQDYNLPIYGQQSMEETMCYLIEKVGKKIRNIDLRPRDPYRPTILYNGTASREHELDCLCEACQIRRQYCEY